MPTCGGILHIWQRRERDTAMAAMAPERRTMTMPPPAAAVLAMMMALLLGPCRGDVVQFIFGDSLSDVGNNNYLTKSLARAATPWYGIDFGSGMPNGRFCNGRTVADIVGDKMGLPRPAAFLDPSLDADAIFKNGVNYASGGGGILNETSSLFIQRFSLYKQIELFQGTQAFMREKLGAAAADRFFSEAYYVVAMGANDFINNYLLPVYSDSWSYNGETFVRYVVNTLEAQLRLLHALGARRLTFFGLGPMGCIPLQRYLQTSSAGGGCQESTNKLARSFNAQAGAMVARLTTAPPTGLANATFRFGEAYDFFRDMIDRPGAHGFNDSRAPCCTLGRIRPTLTCTPLSTLCRDRSQYVFWDEYHPTDRANELIALETLRKLNVTVTVGGNNNNGTSG